jgi:hypothetical protein
MILVLLIQLPLLLLAVWAFYRLSPVTPDQRGVRRFNTVVVLLGLGLCGLVAVKVYSDLLAGPDRAWWPVVSALYSLALFPGVLLVGGLIRNLVLFRSDRPAKGSHGGSAG